ncbi:uncharacterized protein LOC144442658 [Glandiceps talaboti]
MTTGSLLTLCDDQGDAVSSKYWLFFLLLVPIITIAIYYKMRKSSQQPEPCFPEPPITNDPGLELDAPSTTTPFLSQDPDKPELDAPSTTTPFLSQDPDKPELDAPSTTTPFLSQDPDKPRKSSQQPEPCFPEPPITNDPGLELDAPSTTTTPFLSQDPDKPISGLITPKISEQRGRWDWIKRHKRKKKQELKKKEKAQFKRLLIDLEGDISQDEFKRMKQLCTLQERDKENILNPSGLFERMEKEEIIELLKAINRIDLKERFEREFCLCTKDVENEKWQDLKLMLHRHIAQEIPTEEFCRMKDLSGIPVRDLEGIHNPLELFTKLKKQGDLSINNTTKVEQLLEQVKLISLKDELVRGVADLKQNYEMGDDDVSSV